MYQGWNECVVVYKLRSAFLLVENILSCV